MLTREAPKAMSPVYPESAPMTMVSYSGQDIRASIYRFGEVIELGSLYTISHSSHRDLVPGYGLGQANAQGIGRGYRTIAGTMVFLQFNKDALYDLISYAPEDRNAAGWFPLMIDQAPPFNLLLLFSSEAQTTYYSGDRKYKGIDISRGSRLVIYGVHFSGQGGTVGVDNLITEEIFNYQALGMSPLTDLRDENPIGNPNLTSNDGYRLLLRKKGLLSRDPQSPPTPTVLERPSRPPLELADRFPNDRGEMGEVNLADLFLGSDITLQLDLPTFDLSPSLISIFASLLGNGRISVGTLIPTGIGNIYISLDFSPPEKVIPYLNTLSNIVSVANQTLQVGARQAYVYRVGI